MKNSRRTQLLQHIAEITSLALSNKDYTNSNTDAFTISLDLNLDRANVSRMLNDLWRENELIKIQGRPTFYLHRKTILRSYPNSYIPAVIPKNETLTDYLEQSLKHNDQHCKEAFTSLIGNSPHESLYGLIHDLRTYLHYPKPVYSILLHGPIKCGKHQLAEAVLRFIGEESRPQMTIDCTAILLGKLSFTDIITMIDQQLEQDGDQIILFDHLHSLGHKQELFHDFCALLQYYQHMAENNDLDLLLLACASDLTKDQKQNLDIIFQKTYELPHFDERTLKEKYEFVLYFLQSQADAIGKTISLSSSILNCFATAMYPHSIQSLEREITHTLSHAYLQSLEGQDTFLSIDYQHLSDDLLSSIQDVSLLLPQIESITFTLKEKNHFLIPETECLPLQKLLHTQISEDGIIRITAHKELKLSEYCKQELRNALNQEVHQLYSLSLHKVKEALTPLLQKYSFYINVKQLDKLCFRLSNLGTLLKNQTYNTNFIADPLKIDNTIKKISEQISAAVEALLKIELPELEQQYISYYLQLSQDTMKRGDIAVIVACQGEGIAEKYAMHVNTMKYRIKCHWINCEHASTSSAINDYLAAIADKVLEIEEGCGTVIITDLNPLMDFDTMLKSNIDIDTVTLSPTSLPLLIQVMNLLNDPSITLEDIRSYDYGTILHIPQEQSEQSTERNALNEAADKILEDSLVFLNANKATKALFRVLMQIYEDLGIHYSNDISVRFIFHSAFMIERVIRKEPLIYKNTSGMISASKEVYESIDRNMQLINDLFGIQIPSTEIARISEIFVELLQETKESF